MSRSPERLKSGRWKVRFRYGGKQTSETFDTKRDADSFARTLDAIGPGPALDWLGTEKAEAVPTMDDLAAEHIEHLTGIEQGTRVKYARLWASAWSPTLGALPANQVSKDAVSAAVNALEARGYAAKTIRNQHSLLSAVCGRAVEQGHLAANPARGARLPRSKESEAVEMRILTPAEFELVAERIHPHYRGFVRFLAGTGARFGEAVALQVQDVTLPDIRIRRALKWSPDRAAQRIAAPKTRRGNRTIRIGAALAPDVAGACQGKARADLVWTAPKGGSIQHRTFWSDIWLPAVVDLEPRPRIHDLRHSHASWLIAQGVPLIVVQRRLGHESIKTTGDTYGHLLPDAELAATLAADAALGYAPHPELD